MIIFTKSTWHKLFVSTIFQRRSLPSLIYSFPFQFTKNIYAFFLLYRMSGEYISIGWILFAFLSYTYIETIGVYCFDLKKMYMIFYVTT